MAIFLTGGLASAQISQAPQTPPAPPPSGAISGVVMDGASGAPLSDVVVTLLGGSLPPEYRTRQMSDARGRFAFINLPDADTYQVVASKFGHLEGGYGRDRGPLESLRFIPIKNGTWTGNLKVPIWRPSTVSGAVRDENGDPVVGVFVRALVRMTIAGHDALVAGPMTVTDDRGSYRLSGLLPGRYLFQVPSVQMSVPGGTRIGASTTNDPFGAVDVDDTTRLVIGRYPLPPPRRENRPMTYPAAFHPAGSAADAMPIEIKFNEDRAGVDITLTPAAAVRVSGVVEAPPEALNGLTLRLLPTGLENLGLGAETATALVAADGSFSFLNVPAGTYTLDAPLLFHELTLSAGTSFSGGGSVGFGPSRQFPNPPPSGSWSRTSSSVDGAAGVSVTSSDFRNGQAPNYSGRTTVTVSSSNLTGVVLKLFPLGTVRGRIVVESDPARPGAKPQEPLIPRLDPASGQARLGMPRGRPVKDSTDFEISGVQPGEYWIRVPANGYLVKSISWRGRDYTLAPIDTASGDDLTGVVVTMTNAVPTLNGAVRLPDGVTADNVLVVLFPASPALRVNTGFNPVRVRSISPQSNGSFSLTTLPAGDYFIAAIDHSLVNTWRNSEFMTGLERTAARVTLSWGQTVNQTLTMVTR